jgi:hypothetical protein
MVCAHSKSRWAENKRVMKETIEQYHASKFEVRWLNEEKVA